MGLKSEKKVKALNLSKDNNCLVKNMPQFRMSLLEKYYRPLKRMAQEYGLTLSDLMNEASEWILDQETAFRKDLERTLSEEEGEEEAESTEEGESEEEYACDQCGADVEELDDFCSSCGRKFEEEEEGEGEENETEEAEE